MVLTEEQLNFYHANGYLHIKNIFSHAQCDELVSEAHKFAGDHITNYLDIHKLPKFQEVHTGKIMCEIGDQILGDRAIPVGSIFFFCKPNNPLENGSTWHQDNYAGKAPFGSYLNISLALDDADKSNGSLMVMPGSHKLGDLPCNPKANFAYDDQGKMYCASPIGNDCEIPDNMPIVQLEYKKGDVIILHGHLVHKAEKNMHPSRWRRVMYFVYVKDGSPFWPGWTAKRELLKRFDS